jgi:uncharacterized protein (DUF58 family)
MPTLAGLPRRETFPLISRERIIGLAFGMLPSGRRGSGHDTAGSRPYVPGDDIDAIDWAASARLSSARDSDEFIVRQRYAEEAPRVVVVVDRRPSMSLYPPGYPWLSKPRALAASMGLIAQSAFAARGLVGTIDVGEVDETGRPYWLPPRAGEQLWGSEAGPLGRAAFGAPEDSIERCFSFLFGSRHGLAGGTFVFVLSDFLAPPPVETWLHAAERGWDVIPVVVCDPTWEATFPAIDGVVVPLGDPATGAIADVRLSRRQAAARARANEERLVELERTFASFGIESVQIRSSDPQEVLTAFGGWADGRSTARRRAW